MSWDFSEAELENLAKFSKFPFGFYSLLGFVLAYYAGSFNPKQQIVQRFAVYPSSPDNETRVKRLERIASRFLSETALENDVAVCALKSGDDDTATIHTVSSANICRYLAKIEYNDIDELFECAGSPATGARSVIDRQRLEFLAGAYARHGRNPGEWFFNDYRKMLLCHRFICRLASEGDRITTETRIAAPGGHYIRVETGSALWRQIDKDAMAGRDAHRHPIERTET